MKYCPFQVKVTDLFVYMGPFSVGGTKPYIDFIKNLAFSHFFSKHFPEGGHYYTT